MALDGTAVMDAPDNGDTLVATEAMPAESDELVIPDSGGADETTDSEDQDSEPQFTKAQLAAEVAKAEKAAQAKAEESARQKALAKETELKDQARAEAFNQRASAAQRYRQGLAATELKAMVKDVEEGRDIDQAKFNRMVVNLDNAAFHELHSQYVEHFEIQLSREYPEFKVPQELQTKLDRANRSYDRAGMADAWLETMKAAITESLSPKLRAQVEAELLEADEAAGKTARIKDADEKRGQQGRPANVTGGTSSRPTSTKNLTLAQALALEESGELNKLIERERR